MVLIFLWTFVISYAEFKILDAEDMRDQNVNIFATPPLFGYDETESKLIWPQYLYPEW